MIYKSSQRDLGHGQGFGDVGTSGRALTSLLRIPASTMMPFSPGPQGAPSPPTMAASMPGRGRVADPGLMGSIAIPQGLPKTGPLVSVCHMWSMTGMRPPSTVFCSVRQNAGVRSTGLPARRMASHQHIGLLAAGTAPRRADEPHPDEPHPDHPVTPFGLTSPAMASVSFSISCKHSRTAVSRMTTRCPTW